MPTIVCRPSPSTTGLSAAGRQWELQQQSTDAAAVGHGAAQLMVALLGLMALGLWPDLRRQKCFCQHDCILRHGTSTTKIKTAPCFSAPLLITA